MNRWLIHGVGRWCCLVAAMLVSHGVHGAEPSARLQSPRSRAVALYREAEEIEKKAGQATDRRAIIRYNMDALKRYFAATKLVPRFYQAHRNAAYCLATLTREVRDPAEKRKFAEEARVRYSKAAHEKHPYNFLYFTWGKFNVYDALPLYEDRASRQEILEEARGAYEQGRQHLKFTRDLAQADRERAICLVRLGQELEDPQKKKAAYDQGIALFESVVKVETETKRSATYAEWGRALLRVGQLRQDRLSIRKSMVKFNDALERDADNGEARYLLACAQAVLNHVDSALRTLGTCLENDPEREFLNRAMRNADFDSLRRTLEYRKLIAHHATFDPDVGIQ